MDAMVIHKGGICDESWFEQVQDVVVINDIPLGPEEADNKIINGFLRYRRKERKVLSSAVLI